MEEIILRNEYRCLNDGEKTKWKQLTSISEFIWDGVYAIRLVADEPSLGLPFKVNGEEVINLLVNDQFRDNHIQNNRIIVQTLTRVERSTGRVQTYIRTRRYNNGEHKWDEWTTDNSGVATGSSVVVDNDINTESTNPVQNKAIAQALEDAVARGRELAKRDLYITAGALYNDTDEVIERTAFWGEKVQHLPKHYYLNGLGDITEEQMSKIYAVKDTLSLIQQGANCSRLYQYDFSDNYNDVRTFFPLDISYSGRRIEQKFFIEAFYTFYKHKAEVLQWTRSSRYSYYGAHVSGNCSNMFSYMPNLRCIDILQSGIDAYAFYGCPKLEYFKIKKLGKNLHLTSSPLINKESLIYTIINSSPTTAITITLHADAYARLIVDEDVIAALESIPLVSLVSA